MTTIEEDLKTAIDADTWSSNPTKTTYIKEKENTVELNLDFPTMLTADEVINVIHKSDSNIRDRYDGADLKFFEGDIWVWGQNWEDVETAIDKLRIIGDSEVGLKLIGQGIEGAGNLENRYKARVRYEWQKIKAITTL